MTQSLTVSKNTYKNKGFRLAVLVCFFSLARGVEAWATATPLPPVSVYSPDIFLEFSNRKQVGHSTAHL